MPRQPKESEFEGGLAQSYLSWNNADEFKEVLKATAGNIDSYDGYQRSAGSLVSDFGRTFINTDANMSVRSEYNRADYEHYRGSERIPTKDTDIIRMCMQAYERVSIVRNIIDMMGDFTVQGIRLVHPNKKIENFHKNWFKAVNGPFVSERIANMLYRTANCPVKIRMGKVPVAVEDDWRKNYAEDDIKINQIKPASRTIPLGYNILNPLTLEVIGGELSAFVGRPIYALKLSHKFKMMMKQNEALAIKNAEVRQMMQSIPDSVRSAIIAGMSVVPLDQSKIEMLYYKKDDWKVWSTPMLYSILEPLIMLEKMHLADISALDGAISQIRLWRLGDIENKILPTRAAINKLRNILASVGAGVLELVWGPELDFKETTSQVHHYLASEKYDQVMYEINSGLGIPDTLTGGGDNKGFTNNAIAMKTLVERLEYGRRVIEAFWNKELKKVQKAMGWRFPAKVVFDFRVLGDEIAERSLLVDMWDREILSTESLHELSRRDPEIEEVRIKREAKKRKDGNLPEKAGPYHNAQWDIELKKILLQGGAITPSEADVKLEPKKEGEKPMVVQTQEHEGFMADKQNQNALEIADKSSKQQMMATKQQQEHQVRLAKMNNKAKIQVAKSRPKPKGVSGSGRPKNSRDKTTRKTRTAKPRKAAAEVLSRRMWAIDAQKTIADITTPFLLEKFGKKNLRSFTKAETEQAEFFKFSILNHIEPYSEITEEKVYNILQQPSLKCDEEIISHCKTLAAVFTKHHGREPSLEETREIQATAYSLRFQPIEN